MYGAVMRRGAHAHAGGPRVGGGGHARVHRFLRMGGGTARLIDGEDRKRRYDDQADDDRRQSKQFGNRVHHTARLDRAMDVLAEYTGDLMRVRERLIEELREHALVLGAVTLTSGARAEYYVDAKRAILRPEGFAAVSTLLAAQVSAWNGTAVGGMTMGADPLACAALAGGARIKAFFVRKETKAHGLQRRIEGPPLAPEDRCVVVEDVVTTGGSTLAAIEALKEAGQKICGVISVLDRLAGGGTAIERAAGAPYVTLSTIDEVYPERPDRE